MTDAATSFDRYLDRCYEPGRYDCLSFARDVWLDLTGIDIRERLFEVFAVFDPVTRAAATSPRHFEAFRRLNAPQSPCLVYMERRIGYPHLGVFARGRVVHLLRRGVECVPLDLLARLFRDLRFYAC